MTTRAIHQAIHDIDEAVSVGLLDPTHYTDRSWIMVDLQRLESEIGDDPSASFESCRIGIKALRTKFRM